MSNQSQPRVHVGIDDALYYRSHGKAPRGRGGWLFFIDGDRDASRAFNANGTFAEARKVAMAEAKRRAVEAGVNFVMVEVAP